MTGAEAGLLLLTSHMGDPERNVLTVPQFRVLAQRVRAMEAPREDRELTAADLTALGYGQDMAQRILALLSEEERLRHYLNRGRKLGCGCITRISQGYPARLLDKLGLDAPCCLWAKGELSILETPVVALVGSRALLDVNRTFAEEVGRQAALQGYTLVSGNARGADQTAQESCLRHGGQVISIVADPLVSHRARKNVLYLSEDCYDEPFSAQRALSRNRCIHAMGEMTFVAQSDLHRGGTWDGTVKNLRHHWSDVLGFHDGSEAMETLERMGLRGIGMDALSDFSALIEKDNSLFSFE